MKANPKVVVVVSGGVVDELFASLPDTEIDIEVIDCDDLKAEGKSSADIELLVAQATNHLYIVR